MENATTAIKSERPSAAGASEDRAASAVLDDLESLRRRFAEAEERRDEYLSLLRRARADFENFQKRVQRDRAGDTRYAIAEFARELLPVLDNLERALDSTRQHGEAGPLVDGVGLVRTQLADVFNRFGVTRIDALGQSFNANIDEVAKQQHRTDVPGGTVVEVLSPGNRLNDRVLRPAKVVLAG